jgi:hypothetical protein
MSPDPPELLAFGADRGLRELRERAGERNVLAVLTESTADEWYRQWERSTASAAQVALVECYDTARTTAASGPAARVVSDDLALSTLQRPLDAGPLSDVLTEFLDGWEAGSRETIVYVDSLEQLLADVPRPELDTLFTELLDRIHPTGSGIVVTADPETDAARAVAEYRELFSETAGAPEPNTEAIAAVRRLQEEDPSTFGYVRRYWYEAVRALEQADRAYPQAKQLHEAVETELSPRMLGAALSGLASLDAISVRGNTNGPNRYNRQSYDPERAARLGLAVESLAEE